MVKVFALQETNIHINSGGIQEKEAEMASSGPVMQVIVWSKAKNKKNKFSSLLKLVFYILIFLES